MREKEIDQIIANLKRIGFHSSNFNAMLAELGYETLEELFYLLDRSASRDVTGLQHTRHEVNRIICEDDLVNLFAVSDFEFFTAREKVEFKFSDDAKQNDADIKAQYAIKHKAESLIRLMGMNQERIRLLRFMEVQATEAPIEGWATVDGGWNSKINSEPVELFDGDEKV